MATHPGKEAHDRLESLKSVLRLLNKTADASLNHIDTFHREAHRNNLFYRSRRHERKALEEAIQENLYVFSASAMTLVDQARVLNDRVQILGYRDRICNSFADSPLHRFIQELRVDLVHVSLHEPSWLLTVGRDDQRTTRFLLHRKELGRVDSYNSLAKRFVAEHPDGIDIGATVSQYRDEVNVLHHWLHKAAEEAAGDILSDYRRCNRIIAAVGSRQSWRLMLSQVVIQGKRDPYAYLDRYLTPLEIGEVMSLPYRSSIQIDRIVELVDDHGACDDELRNLVYEAFQVRRS